MKGMSAFALSLAAALLASGAQAANLIQNGSFETASDGSLLPALTGPGLALANGNTAMAGWTVIGGTDGDGLAWLGKGNQFGPTTPFGNYFLDLAGYHDRTPYFGVEQTISTVAGESYSLTFNLGVDQDDGRYDGPIGVTATAGSTSKVFDNFNPDAGGNVWQSFTLNFTAGSSSTLVSIVGEQGDQYIGLDQVSVTGMSESVPEPSTWAMMLIGFAGFAFAGYHKAKKNKVVFAAV
jgi:hypothetical protein